MSPYIFMDLTPSFPKMDSWKWNLQHERAHMVLGLLWHGASYPPGQLCQATIRQEWMWGPISCLSPTLPEISLLHLCWFNWTMVQLFQGVWATLVFSRKNQDPRRQWKRDGFRGPGLTVSPSSLFPWTTESGSMCWSGEARANIGLLSWRSILCFLSVFGLESLVRAGDILVHCLLMIKCST